MLCPARDVLLCVLLIERSPIQQSVVGSNPTHGSSSFFLGNKELSWVLYLVDLFVVPLPFYLVVDTCKMLCYYVPTEDPPAAVAAGREATTPSRVHKRNERGETQLHVACIRGDLRLATSLIEQGAEVNATDHAGINVQ